MKLLAAILLLTSCGHVQFDINGVGHENSVVSTEESLDGCFRDSDCTDGKVCATIKGEYPGSCAGTGGGGLLIGGLLLGAAAAAMANEDGGYRGTAGSNYAPPVQNTNYQGCCSYHNGVNSCGGQKIVCNDGWISGCDC
jgi:hypothetical protein